MNSPAGVTAESVAVVGIGIVPHGRHPDLSASDMGVRAIRLALEDAGVEWKEIDFAAGGSMMSGNPDTVVRSLGLTGVPFTNIRNACATGASTLLSASTALRTGMGELACVVGYDKHERGAFALRPDEMSLGDWYGQQGLMLTTQFFAMKVQRYMHDHGISSQTLARVAEKAYRNGSLTPTAFRRKLISAEEILASDSINPPLTKFMFCSPDEGAVALILATRKRAAALERQPIHLRGIGLRTRRFGSFDVYSPSTSLVYEESPTVAAARDAFSTAGLRPCDVDVAQIQDTEAGAEVMGMAEVGLCRHGEQEELIAAGETEIAGSLPVNTDGGAIAHGEPVGSNGLRQVHEIVLQLRGEAGERQVGGALPEVGFTQVYGAPGVAACTVLTGA